MYCFVLTIAVDVSYNKMGHGKIVGKPPPSEVLVLVSCMPVSDGFLCRILTNLKKYQFPLSLQLPAMTWAIKFIESKGNPS